MSDIDDDKPEMVEIMNKMTKYNKNIKSLMDIMTKALEKLDEVLNRNLNQIKNDDNDDASDEASRSIREKERVGKILEKRGLGRPKGDHNSKRLQYFEMVKSKKIKEPKPQTLQYYQINYDKFSDTYTLLDIDD